VLANYEMLSEVFDEANFWNAFLLGIMQAVCPMVVAMHMLCYAMLLLAFSLLLLSCR